MTMIQLIKIIGRDRRGGPAVQMALILPVLVVTLFGIIEMGRLMWTESALHYAVSQAARCRSVDAFNCGTDAAAKSYAVTKSIYVNVGVGNFTVGTCTGGKQVSAAYTFTSTLLLLPSAFTVNVNPHSCYPTPLS
ncbi:MAG TPA: TadE family protein [Aliidongia sp.]|nr:TadE family protein [Aliidongia sp.]